MMKKFGRGMSLLLLGSLLSACGGGNSGAGEAPARPEYKDVLKTHGEAEVQAVYVDVMAHMTLNFLKGVIEEDVDLMSMTQEERDAYARKRGAMAAEGIRKKIEIALEKNGWSLAEWAAVTPVANEEDWYGQFGEKIQARKAELQKQLDETGSL